ncbi:MAG: Indoleamine 2,3-dioxygenase, partial [Olpidium bornovanus]
MFDDASVFGRTPAKGRGVSSEVPVPALQDYDVSPLTGFLPEEPPLTKLEDPYYQPWEALVENLNSLMLAGQLRGAVHKVAGVLCARRWWGLPLLDHARLRNVRELRRAFLVLCMIGHAYVWGKAEPPSEILPEQLAVPWHYVADKLQLRPVVCQAAVVLWNWKLLDPKKEWDLSNFAALHTYSGSTDEAWFYLVTTAIEAEGAKALPACIAAQHAARSGNIEAAISALETIERVVANLNVILKRMYDHCDPYVFYWRIRPYLAGWDNMADAGLPHGVRYEGVPNLGAGPGEPPAYRKYAGGSAAQSSLIQALDVALGIEHRPTGQHGVPEKHAAASQHGCSAANLPHAGDTANGHAAAHRQNGAASGTCNGVCSANNDVPAANGKPEINHDKSLHHNFILRMRDYMPGPHRRFLDHLAKAATLRTFVKDVVSPRPADAS